MKNNIFSVSILILLILLSGYLALEQIMLKKQFTKFQSEVKEQLKNKDEIELKKLKIINKFGDTVIELSENTYYSGSISIFNKSKVNTIRINGGNKDENAGLLILKGADKASLALMVQDDRNILSIYNKNGLDAVSLGTDEHGHGGYSIKNANEKVIKTEGWGWRAYNY